MKSTGLERMQSPFLQGVFFEDMGNNLPHPTLFKLADSMPLNSTIMDIGTGFGRASMPFALRGMAVRAIDEVGTYLTNLESLADDGLDYETLHAICGEDSPVIGEHDLVLLNDVVFHAPSQEKVIEMLDWAYMQVKPGGLLWVNYMVTDSVANQSDHEKSLSYEAMMSGFHAVTPTHFRCECSCSGVSRVEDIIFIDPFLIPMWAAHNGADFVEAKLTPGNMNEYWDSGMNRSVYSEKKDKSYVLISKPAEI